MGDGGRAVRVERDGDVAVVRLAGRHGNAVNDELLDGLLGALEEVGGDGGLRGVLLASSGKLFCPGLDLQDLVAFDRPALDAFMEKFSRCMLALYTMERPLVAALHGHAIAGGCVLAMTADWRVLARGALIGLNEVKVGVPLPWGVAQILRDAVTAPRLEEVCLLGRNYADEEALATGLAHQLAEPGSVETAALDRLRELAGRDPVAFSVTKRYLRHAAVRRIREAEEARRGEFLDGWFSPGTRERIQAIAEELKRR